MTFGLEVGNKYILGLGSSIYINCYKNVIEIEETPPH